MHQAFGRTRPALNDNFPAPFAEALAASRYALWRFQIPDAPRHSDVAGAFARFRLAVLADGIAAETHGVRRLPLMCSMDSAAEDLAKAPCAGAEDFSMKAVGASALVYHCAAKAAALQSPEVMIRHAESVADFMAHLAADALCLGARLCGQVGEG